MNMNGVELVREDFTQLFGTFAGSNFFNWEGFFRLWFVHFLKFACCLQVDCREHCIFSNDVTICTLTPVIYLH